MVEMECQETTSFHLYKKEDLSLEEKVAIFISMSKDSTLKPMDRIPYEIKLAKILFKEENKNKEKEKFQINYISYEPELNVPLHRTAKILTYNKKGIDNTKTNNYIFINHNCEMYKTDLKEIRNSLRKGAVRGL